MTLDERDPMDGLLRESFGRDAAAASGSLAGLEGRVLETLAERSPKRGLWGHVKAMAAPTRAGRRVQLAFVGATACACLLLGAFVGGRVPWGRPSEPALLSAAPAPATRSVTAKAPAEGGVLFVLPAPNARVVALVGSFSEWEPMPLSDDDGDGIWTTHVALPPGRHEYAFIIDGRWFGQDPSADEYVKSFGEYSSVRYIGGGGDGA